MEKLNLTTDVNLYLEHGEVLAPFLSDEFIKEKVDIDFNAKNNMGFKQTKLDSLMAYIAHKIMFSEDRDFKSENKFNRTAKQIWESGKSTGCSDYAILFTVFARQLGYATTILHTAEEGWLRKLLNNEDFSICNGHFFCECFFEGKWVLVDPTNRRVLVDYNCDKIKLNYLVNKSDVFYPYLREKDFTLSGKEYTNLMKNYCFNLKLI